MDKDLTVAIFVPTTDEQGNRRASNQGEIGTGYPVGPDLILTARHVVDPDHRDDQFPLQVRWHCDYNRDVPRAGWRELPSDALLWRGSGELDAALLRCPWPEKVRDRRWGYLVDRLPGDDANWNSRGYPRATRYEDAREPADFGGTTHSAGKDDPSFAIIETAEPDTATGWEGVSGMPVFVDGGILGIVKSVPPRFKAQRLDAIPAHRLLKDPDFCRHVGYDAGKELLESYRALILKELKKSDTACRELARKLGMGCEECECREKLTKRILEDTPLEELFHLALQVQDELNEQQQPEAAQVVARLVRSVMPALMDHQLVNLARNSRGDPENCIIFLPAYLHTMAEILMAGVDRRRAKFRAMKAGEDWPHGEYLLPQMPEPGRNAGGSQTLRDWDTEFIDRFEVDDTGGFEKIFHQYMQHRFVGSDVRRDRRTVPPEKLRAYIRNKLRIESERRQATYYYVVTLPDELRTRGLWLSLIKALKKEYPHVVFLELSSNADLLLEEQQRYELLLVLLTPPGAPA